MSVLLEVEMPEGAFSALKQDHEGLSSVSLLNVCSHKWIIP